MAKKYSEEQVSRAKNVDLEQFLAYRGETLKRMGSESKWIYRDSTGTHDSVTVKGNKWYDHKRQQGGDSIGFLQEFMGLSFRESVEELLGGEQANELYVKNYPIMQAPQTKRNFTLPEKSGNMHKLYAYLTKTRFISADIVNHFVKAKMLFQDNKHDNIVFLGLDENGVPRAGQKKSTNSFSGYKGTLSGSETWYGFGHKGTSNKLFTFEAPIDLLSYLTIYPNNWQEHNYIALDGLSTKAMFYFLENNPQVDEVDVCIDFDAAGIESYDKHRDLLIEAGYTAENIKRTYPVFKDWNESLKAEHGIKPIPSQNHPKIVCYGEIVATLSELYESTKSSYGERFATFYDEKGLSGLASIISLEFDKFKKSIDNGKVMKLNSPNADEYLLRMANFCVMGFVEINQTQLNKKSVYKTIVNDLFENYKPYMDKGKLKNHYSELEQSLESLKKTLMHHSENEMTMTVLQNFADNCIRTKIYIETMYEQDLAQQQALLNFDQRKVTIIDPQQSENLVMQMF